MSLRDERCEECHPGTPLLSAGEVDTLRSEIHSRWEVNAAGHLRRTVRCRDFAAALALAVRCGMIAEVQGHHPDVTVAWGRLDVEIWTHVAGGLTRADLVLAARLDPVLGD